jgi:hypothetical protein
MKKGECYAFKDHDGRYKKVEFYRESEDPFTDNTIFYVEYVIHSPSSERYNRGCVNFDYFLQTSRLLSRNTHCWNCKHPIDEIADDICFICGGIICPKDHKCMCGYVKK